MYSLLHTTKNAHDDGIWSCAWGQIREVKNKTDDEKEGLDETEETDNAVDIIVTASVDDLIKVWFVRDDSLELCRTMSGHSLGVVSVALNSDCTICASSSLDATLYLWNMATSKKMSEINIGPVEIWTVAFSPDDEHIIAGSQSGKINMFSVKTGELERAFDTRGKFLLSIAYSPDGKYLASGALDGIINIFDVQSGKLTHTLEGHAMPIRSLCFSPNSERLLTASDDGHMKVYSVRHAELVGTVSGHASWVLSVSFSPDSKYFVSSSADRTVKVWQFDNLQCAHTFKDHSDQVWCAQFSTDGKKIVSVSEDCSINVYKCPGSN